MAKVIPSIKPKNSVIKVGKLFTIKKFGPGQVSIYKRTRFMQIVSRVSYAKKIIAEGRFKD